MTDKTPSQRLDMNSTRKADEILQHLQTSGYAIAADWADSKDANKAKEQTQKALYEYVCKNVIGEDEDTDLETMAMENKARVRNELRTEQRKAAVQYFGQGEHHE